MTNITTTSGVTQAPDLPGHIVLAADCAMHPLYHDAECAWDFKYFQSWCLSHPLLPYYAVIAYGIAIYVGSACMKQRPAYDLKTPLFLWNACLAAFSIMGTLRTGTELAHVLSNNGFYASICYSPTDNVTSLWRFAFVMSKFAEVCLLLLTCAQRLIMTLIACCSITTTRQRKHSCWTRTSLSLAKSH